MLLPFLIFIIFGLQQIDADASHQQRCEIMLKTDLLQRYAAHSLQDWLSSSSQCHKDIKHFKNCYKYLKSLNTFKDVPMFNLYQTFDLDCVTEQPTTFIADCDPDYGGLGDIASTLITKGNLSADQREQFVCDLASYWKGKKECIQKSDSAISMIFNYISIMSDRCESSREQQCEANLKTKLLKRYVSGSFKDWFASSGCQNDMDDYKKCQRNTMGKNILRLYELLAKMCSDDPVTIFEDCDPCHEALGESDSTMIKQGTLSKNQTEDAVCKLVQYWEKKSDCLTTSSIPDTMNLDFDAIWTLMVEDCKQRTWTFGDISDVGYGIVTQPTTESSQPDGICSISTQAQPQPSTIIYEREQTTEPSQPKVDVGQVMNPDPESWSNTFYSVEYHNPRSGFEAKRAASPNLRGFCGMVMTMTAMAVLAGA